MYTILIKDNNEMIGSIIERIMQRSSGIDKIRFLVAPTYNDIDMADCTLLLEYRLPISKELKSIILEKSEELYRDNIEYLLPIDINLTKEAGKIEIQASFLRTTMEADGAVTSKVRKIQPYFIDIIPISAWSNMIPDSEFAAIDQRILKLDAIANQLSETNNSIMDSKADDISYKDNTIQLLANGKKIGTSHVLDQQKETDLIDFGNEDDNDNSENEYTLVEF